MNEPVIDTLIASLLRAALWLSETGAALKLQNPNSTVAEHLLLEANYARTQALEAATAQNVGNFGKLTP